MQDVARVEASSFLLANENPLEINGRFIDGRSRVARSYRNRCFAIAADLGGTVSVTQAMLIRRACILAEMAEKYEAQYLETGDVDIDRYNRIVNPLTKVLDRLGYKRQLKDITPHGDIIDAHTAELIRGGA